MQGLAATHRRGYARVLDADVRRLRDGTLVAMHDATLDRTTDHRGRVGALDWAAWQRVRLTPSPGLPGRWRPERPPSVREILDRFGGRSLLMLELKDPAGLPRLARLIRNRQLSRSVLVESNDPRVAERAHGLGLLTAVWRSAAQLAHDRPARWQRYVDDAQRGPPDEGPARPPGGPVGHHLRVVAHRQQPGGPRPDAPPRLRGLRHGQTGRPGPHRQPRLATAVGTRRPP
ncbi:hypothetical protein TPA0909_00770 [Streptomyces albus]|nr:hypothetical protein TPA0909_00770 [Streptomyces albus]